jgi:hypothetical protein
VSRFAENAARVLEAAEAAAQAGVREGVQATAMTILVSAREGIRLVADSEWGLEALRQHHAADEAYRVVHERGVVRVEGADGKRRCRMEAASPVRIARFLLDRPAAYRMTEDFN